MVDVYKSLMKGARFYQNVWDRKTSVERPPSYGNSRGKGVGTERHDLLLEMPVIPSVSNLDRNENFKERYEAQIEEASQLFYENDELIHRLMDAVSRVSRNQYNLEVLLSIAYFERFTINTILHLSQIDGHLQRASESAEAAVTIDHMISAHELAGRILEEQELMWNHFTATWHKSRFEKNRSVNGRDFVHVMDDVKDHFADRRAGLDYMLAPFQRMDIHGWRKKLYTLITDYAQLHNVPIAKGELERLED